MAAVPLPFKMPEIVVEPVPPYGTPMVEAFQIPEVRVPTVARLARVVMFGSVVVAERRLSKSVLLQYLLVEPCASASVVVAYQLARGSFASSAVWRSVWLESVPVVEPEMYEPTLAAV